VCTVGYSGFVPLMKNRLGMTFNEATHAALNDFTLMVNPMANADQPSGCDNISRRTTGSSSSGNDNASCHIGCSTQPPRPC